MRASTIIVVGGFVVASGCGSVAPLGRQATLGPSPRLVEPRSGLLPTVNVVTAVGWPDGATPIGAPGLMVTAFARGLDHPRWLHVLPNGDVLVAETNAPPRPDDNSGLRGWLFSRFQAKAGGAVPSADRLTLLRDADRDGVAEVRTVFLDGLHSPFGMALVDDRLYVANTDALVSVPYTTGATVSAAGPERLLALPAGPRNHHWTKSLIASADGARLYVGVGSNSNAGEHGLGEEQGRAAILEVSLATGDHRVFASGLRNPVGMAWAPDGSLWVSVNERDELGPDLVPDYMTAVRDGGFYGFPFSYWGSHPDDRVSPQRPDLVARAIVPDYALGAHTASLGLAASDGTLGSGFSDGMFVGQHGSWNREPRVGYRVIFVPFTSGRPSGLPVDVLTGFVRDNGEAMGRPVGVAPDGRGGLLVADDVGNAIWRVTRADRTTADRR